MGLKAFKKWAKEQSDNAGDNIRAAGRAIDKAVFQPVIQGTQKATKSVTPTAATRSIGSLFRRARAPKLLPKKKPAVLQKIQNVTKNAGDAIGDAGRAVAKEVKHIVKPVAGEVAMRAKDLANSKAVKQAGDAIGDGLRSFDKNVIQPVSTSKTMKTIQGKAQQAADYVGDEVRNIPGSLKNMAQASQDPEKGFYPLPYFTKHIPDAVADVFRGGWRMGEGLATLDGDQILNGFKTAGSGILGAGEHTIKGGILPIWSAVTRNTGKKSSSVQEYDEDDDGTVVTVGDKEDVQTGTVNDIKPGTVASGGAQTAARSREFPDTDDVMPEGPDDSGRNTIGVPTEPTKRTGPIDASQSSGGMTALTGATPEQLYSDFYTQFKDIASPLDMVMYKIAADSGDFTRMKQIMDRVKARG